MATSSAARHAGVTGISRSVSFISRLLRIVIGSSWCSAKQPLVSRFSSTSLGRLLHTRKSIGIDDLFCFLIQRARENDKIGLRKRHLQICEGVRRILRPHRP